MLTVESLLNDCELELLAGAGERRLRWVHITEHEDPTPWLSGGEMLLTTGYNLGTPAKQRRFVELVAAKGAAAVGFGTGFDHKRVPKAIIDASREHDVPLFEVPYEMPFIAITEQAAARLINEHYDVLARGTEVHQRLERLVIEGSSLDEITSVVAGAIGGAALVFDDRGKLLARDPEKGGASADAVSGLAVELRGRARERPGTAFEPEEPALAGRALAVPVPGGRGLPPAGWVAVVAASEPLGDFERLLARQASLVVGLELMRERVVRDTERRLAGDVLADALSGRLDADELSGRLRPFGIGAEAAVLVFELEDPPAAELALERALADSGVSGLVATTGAAGRPFLCALIDGSEQDPVAVARDARAALLDGRSQLRAAASRVAPVGSLRRAFHEARCALEATSVSNGEPPEVASHRDLGAFTLLLSLQDEDALRLYSDGLLEPIQRGEGEYGGELLRSLEAFIENNGNWERAARQLYCHRHTLRYRIRKIEELTGHDLSRATDRIEFWLAIRARELVR